MCGIAGIVHSRRAPSRLNDGELVSAVACMADALVHRGPDDGGVWADTEAGVALGHRRLSVVDVSSLGHQPMASACGRFTTVFNGEIYNHRVLRRELELAGHRFRGHSDTEVLLAATAAWGLEPALERFNGMFAFALWDAHARTLRLVRDRLGEKPLYYGRVGHSVVFGSELKALVAHPRFDRRIDRNALTLYFRYGFVPGPFSIYEGISKLPPGSLVTIDAELSQVSAPVVYWSARHVAEEGAAHQFSGSASDAIEQLDLLLRDAVRMRMEADVPLGAFLSGGIDSTTIVAIMQKESSRPVKTFTIGSHDRSLDEAPRARRVAAHLGTDHAELYVTGHDVLDVVPRLPHLYDEPFADASQIPTVLVSRLARGEVTVALSGDGGDELFGGYHRHFQGLWQKLGWIPHGLRREAADLLSLLSPSEGRQSGLTRHLNAAPLATRYRVADKLYKLAALLPAQSPEDMYVRMASHWKTPATLVLGATEPKSTVTDSARWVNVQDPTARIMYLDMVTYLPDDILAKVDRASMAVSLEARVPFLDHRVVEFAWRVSPQMKVQGGRGKWLLRQLLYQYIPQALVEGPKKGFSVPIRAWLQGPLRDWSEALLSRERVDADGILNPALVEAVWKDFIDNGQHWEHLLWDVLMFQAWLHDRKRLAYAA
jgi:asparagine synthase (glutamine-hydrolysing)